MVGLFIPDLLFGSKILSAVTAAGYQGELISQLEEPAAQTYEFLIVDLTFEATERLAQIASLAELPPMIAYYSHVEDDLKQLAIEQGIDVVVPRSRINRDLVGVIGLLDLKR